MQAEKFLILVEFLKKDYNDKITELEIKITSISSLATNSALEAIENKILDVRNLVKKIDPDIKISETEKKLTDQVYSRNVCCKIKTSRFSNKDRF